MISLVQGNIVEIGERFAIVDVGGLGYKVHLTDDTLNSLKLETQKKFWTYLAVRENALDIYGFLTKKEEEFFELLIGVSGIGPKSALNILSLVSIETLISSVQTGSIAHLVKISGIGKKTAEKISLELKDKVGALKGDQTPAGMSSDLDAIEALRALGYETDEAREALKKIDRKIEDTGAKVKAALKQLGK